MSRTDVRRADAPKTHDELQQEIAGRYPTLSGQLQRIAHFVVENPDDLALETITELATRAGVQPSSLVRFAQAFGFDGFSTMQRLFRARLVEGSISYRERIQGMRRRGAVGDPAEVLAEFVEQGILSLERLRTGTPTEAIGRAVDILAGAAHVHLVAQRRSFPVAFYLAYALTRLERPCHLADGIGGLLGQQVRLATPKDALVAVSFRSYAPDVVEAVAERAAAGVPVVAITDSPLSPLAAHATVCFEIPDSDDAAFRSLVAPLCLAQTLVVGLGERLDARNNRPPRKKAP